MYTNALSPTHSLPHTRMRIHTCIQLYIHIYIYIYTFGVSVCVCVCVHTHAYTHVDPMDIGMNNTTCMHVSCHVHEAHSYDCEYICICVWIYSWVYI